LFDLEPSRGRRFDVVHCGHHNRDRLGWRDLRKVRLRQFCQTDPVEIARHISTTSALTRADCLSIAQDAPTGEVNHKVAFHINRPHLSTTTYAWQYAKASKLVVSRLVV
jgi:hypothetical protein